MNRSFLIPTLVPSVLAISSCVLGPTPHAPKMQLPSTISGSSAEAASLADLAWDSVFREPELQSLIRKALKNNADLALASARLNEARALAGQTKSERLPQVNLSATAASELRSINGGQSSVGQRDADSYHLSAPLSWELDLWGRVRRSNEAAKSRVQASEADRQALQCSLIASVASAYIELQNLDERLAIAKRTTASRASSLDLVKTRKEGGVGSELETSQAEALLRQSQLAIPLTEQAIQAKENELRLLLGDFPGSIKRQASSNPLRSDLSIAAGLPASLLQRRCDLRAAALEFEATTADIGVAKALRLPSISLTGSGGTISGNFQNMLDGRSAFYSFGPQVTGPLFDAGRSENAVKAAKARQQQAQARFEKAVQQAFREAADALQNYRTSGEVEQRQTELLAALQNVARIAKARYEGGTSSYLEVLDAERNLFQAEIDLASARRSRQQAVVQTYRALGGGWKD